MDKVDVRFPQPAKAPPSNLPKNALERATVLVTLMARMTSLLQQETAAVQARRPTSELAQFAKDKQPMSLVYEDISRTLRVDREGMRNLPDELKTSLKEAATALYAASAENAEALRLSGIAQKIIVDTVVGVVTKAQKAPTTAYAAHMGGGRGYTPPPNGARASAALNTRL
ncbi:flagellar basal-body protein [Azospirillum sp.]|uniref:flagellar basal-body protein n=1 Tax=Azospirillum sp. TaxID=34012 RepID=UPI00260B6E04|nr:flagellar basal-body protein [Azospirillum sp.]